MKQVKKKMMLGSMAMLMGAGVVVGGGALQEPVVQTAEASTVRYITLTNFALYDLDTYNRTGKFVKTKTLKKNFVFQKAGSKNGSTVVIANGKKYVVYAFQIAWESKKLK